MFHHELAEMQQYQLNQRNFYEWIGYVNTFELDVPCYSTGRRELRKGVNQLFMTTDGLTECPHTSFDNPRDILQVFTHSQSSHDAVGQLLKEIEAKGVRDSTTIVSWTVEIDEYATEPSNK